MHSILVQQVLAIALQGLSKSPATSTWQQKTDIKEKAHNALILCLGDEALKEVAKETLQQVY